MAHRTRIKKRDKKRPQHHANRVSETQEKQIGFTDGSKLGEGEKLNPKFVLYSLLAIFIIALFVRVYFSIDVGTQDDGFRMTGGSDPYYHKRVVDYVLEEREHLTEDPLLNYPLGGENPRPPLFDWMMAVTGLLFAPFFGGDYATSTWWAVQLLPSIFGALTVLPVYFIARDAFGEKYAVFAAFLFGVMPGAISHSTLGLADHDAYFLFFVVSAIYFYQRSLDYLKEKRYVDSWSKPGDIKRGINTFLVENRISLGYAMLAGFSFLALALAWKGFPYAMIIIFVYFIFQLFVSKFKEQDSMGLALITLLTLAIPLIFSAPYYFTVVSPNWWTSPFYVFFATVVLSALFVPTRDFPWVVVVGALGSMVAFGLVLITFIFKGFGESVSGTGYFLRTKLFDTISEAQRPDLSNVVYSFGPTLFFTALFLGLPYLIYLAFKKDKKNLFLLAIWSVISLYMASTAARFLFNATPIVSILGAWGVYLIVEWADLGSLKRNMQKSRLREGAVAEASGAMYKDQIYRFFQDLWRYGKPRQAGAAILVVVLILIPAVHGAIDAGIPFEEKKEWDERWYDTLDTSIATRWALPDEDDYNVSSQNDIWYLGATGPSYPSEYWFSFFDWLQKEDQGMPDEKKPAFISWWDYGFWCIELGEHPTVADNFQNGYETAGSFIISRGETEGIAIFIFRTLEAERNADGLPGNMKDVLGLHLDDSVVADINDVYDNPDDYLIEDVSLSNSMLRTVRDILLTELDIEGLVDLYHDLQVETETSIRYFAVDSRMFPFEATNNIFYAPTVLADESTTKFYDVLYVEGNENGEPTGRKYTAEELEVAFENNPNIRIVDQDIKYKAPFFDSMFYKAFIGYNGADVAGSNEDGIPGVKGIIGNLQPLPGWMMKHFKVVYKTTYWNPYDQDDVDDHPDDWQPLSHIEAGKMIEEKGGTVSSGIKSGVMAIKYYDGAILNGVVRTKDGTPVPNARVTVLDDHATPHDTVITSSDGSYELILPFGNITLLTSFGAMTTQEEKMLMTTSRILNSTTMHINDDQAMRVRNWNLTRDLIVEAGDLSGEVFFDKDNDGSFREGEDSHITEGFMNLSNINAQKKTYYHAEIAEDGSYHFQDIAPGEYILTYTWKNYRNEIFTFVEEAAFLPPNEESQELSLTRIQDVSIKQAKFQGNLIYANGTLATGVDLALYDRNNTVYHENTTAKDGSFLFEELVSSRYDLLVNDSRYQVLPSFRPIDYHTMLSLEENHNNNRLDLLEGNTTDKNETLLEIVHLSGYTNYDHARRGELEVHFYDSASNILKIVESDQKGYYEIDLPYGSYEVQSFQLRGRMKSIFADTLELNRGSDVNYDINLMPSYQVVGHVYWDANEDRNYDIGEGAARVEAFIQRDNSDTDIYAGENSITRLKTDGNGEYSLFLPAGDYLFVYSDSVTSRSITKAFTIDAYEDFAEIKWLNVSLKTGLEVYGSVSREGWLGNGNYDGDIPGARLVFVNEEGSTFVTFTDEDSKYSITLPDAGDYSVTVTSPGVQTYVEMLNVQNRKSSNFKLQPSNIELEGQVFLTKENGKLVDVEDAQLTFTGQGRSFTTRSDDMGSYQQYLPPGEYEVTVRKDLEGFSYIWHGEITMNFGEGTGTRNFTISKLVTVTGTAKERGEDLASLISFTQSEIYDKDGREFTVEYDSEDGYFELELIPGSYTFTIRDIEDENDYIRRVTLTKDTDFGVFDIKDDYEWFRGYVIDDKNGNNKKNDDETVGKTTLIFTDPDNGAYTLETSSTAKYDFFFYQGEYQVTIDQEGYLPFSETLEVMTEQSNYNFLLIPESSTLSGYVWYDFNDNGQFDAQEGIRYQDITMVVDRDDSEVTLKTDASGHYSLDVLPGDYDLKVFFDKENGELRYTTSKKNIEMEPGKNKIENLSLGLKYRVSGYARDLAANRMLEGMDVGIVSKSGNEQNSATSDNEGYFQTYMAPGNYFFYAKGLDPKGVRFATIKPLKVEDEATFSYLNLTEAMSVEMHVYNDTIDNGIDIGVVKIEALDSGDLSFSKSSDEEGVLNYVLPAGEYRFTASSEERDNDVSVKYALDRTLFLGQVEDTKILYLEAEKGERFGLEMKFISQGQNTVYRTASREFELEVFNTGISTESVELTAEVTDIGDNFLQVSFSRENFELEGDSSEIITVFAEVTEEAALGYTAEVIITGTVDDDDTIEVEERIEMNIVDPPRHDLYVKSISVDEQPRKGEYYTVNAVIGTSHDLAPTGPFSVEIRINSLIVDQEEIEILQGENQTTVSFEVEGKNSKEEVKILVDENNDVNETDEDNNSNAISVTIWEAEMVEENEEGTPFLHKFIVVLLASIFIALLVFTYVTLRKKR